MGHRPWLVVLVTGLLLSFAPMVVGNETVSMIAYGATGVLATLAVATAVIVRKPARREAWTLGALGLAATVVALALWSQEAEPGVITTPGAGAAAYLCAYPLLAAALWRLARRGDGADRAALVDSAILGVAGAVLLWTYLLGPYSVASGMSTGERLVAMAYPFGDLLLLPLLARLVLVHRARIPAHLLLLVGVTTLLVADVVYGIGQLNGWYEVGGPLDVLWVLPYTFVAAAAWHPSAVPEPPVNPPPVGLSRRRLAALAAASILAPAVLLFDWSAQNRTARVAAAALIVMFLLVVQRMSGLVRQVDEQASQLEHLSRTDPLTGAANRRVLDEPLTLGLAQLERDGQPFAFAMVDLDHFKHYNDAYGHLAGDELLVEVVRRWRAELREVDLLARYGGEEFAVLLPGCDTDAALQVADRLRAVVPDEQTCSVGLVLAAPGTTVGAVLGDADRALYAAKHAGRDRTVIAPSRSTA